MNPVFRPATPSPTGVYVLPLWSGGLGIYSLGAIVPHVLANWDLDFKDSTDRSQPEARKWFVIGTAYGTISDGNADIDSRALRSFRQTEFQSSVVFQLHLDGPKCWLFAVAGGTYPWQVHRRSEWR